MLLGEACEWVLPIFGVHPWMAPEYVTRLEDLSTAIEQSPMLGEIGLDHHFVNDVSQYPAQLAVFEFLLAAAHEQGKTINLHTKGAETEVLHLLERHDIQRAIVHWYSGPLDVCQGLLARGAYFTIGAEVLFSEHIRTIARELPSDRVLTETDNPGGPKSLTGRPGMPVLIRDVIQALADLRQTTAEAIVHCVHNNYATCIGDDPWLVETHARFFPNRDADRDG